jgi:hypothetical protein
VTGTALRLLLGRRHPQPMEERKRVLRYHDGRSLRCVFGGLCGESMPEHLGAFERIHAFSLVGAPDGVAAL